MQQRLMLFLPDRNRYAAACMIVFDRILNEIKQQSVNQRITADHMNVLTVLMQCNIFLFRKCGEIRQDLVNQRCQFDFIGTGNRLQIAHFQKRADKGSQAVYLIDLKLNQFCGFCTAVRMFFGEQFQFCLHHCQRCTQFMCSISCKLTL